MYHLLGSVRDGNRGSNIGQNVINKPQRCLFRARGLILYNYAVYSLGRCKRFNWTVPTPVTHNMNYGGPRKFY